MLLCLLSSFRLGNVLIYIRLVFKNLTRAPSEADVLKAANAFLDAKIRKARALTQKLSDPVSIQDVTYQSKTPLYWSVPEVSFNNITCIVLDIILFIIYFSEIDNNSYIISFGFQISNVTISKDLQLRNETYDLIQNTINTLVCVGHCSLSQK